MAVRKAKPRRRLYMCCQCTRFMYDYPLLVVDESALWCVTCQTREYGLSSAEANRLRAAQTGPWHERWMRQHGRSYWED